MELREPYLREQLIAYIGSKRSLLPFLHGVLAPLVERIRESRPTPAGSVSFLDPFAGSGAVARLARVMGLRVHANDWEPYTYVINSCHLGIQPSEARRLFRASGGMTRALSELNALTRPTRGDRYISRHYAPRSTANADWRTERLFYTTENALRIDAARDEIENRYPGTPDRASAWREKVLLLAPLLYEAATHTNTSGVFKACHRGFGGHGGDALHRILAPIVVRAPVLWEAAPASTIRCLDAARFLREQTGDLCYLDPPYATHQYGSNYFMLNTIALWDRPPVSAARGADGRLVQKAGIREDWRRTRSAFCYRSTALEAMREVVAAADCRYLVVSYSNEGLIGLEELCDLLSETGELSFTARDNVKYPGGKQSLHRTTRNLELALVVDRCARGPRARGRASAGHVSAGGLLRHVAMRNLLGRSFDPVRVQEAFPTDRGAILVRAGGRRLRLPMRHFWRMEPGTDELGLEGEELDRFLERLSSCEVRDAREELAIVLDLVREETDRREGGRLRREALRLLRRLAHRKNRQLFVRSLAEVQVHAAREESDDGFLAGLARIQEVASRRGLGTPAEGQRP